MISLVVFTAVCRLEICSVRTFVQPSLQPVQNTQALVQPLFDDLPHVEVDLTGLQQLLEGLAQLLQLPAVQSSQPATLLDLLPQLRQLPGLGLHQGVQAVEETMRAKFKILKTKDSNKR